MCVCKNNIYYNLPRGAAAAWHRGKWEKVPRAQAGKKKSVRCFSLNFFSISFASYLWLALFVVGVAFEAGGLELVNKSRMSKILLFLD